MTLMLGLAGAAFDAAGTAAANKPPSIMDNNFANYDFGSTPSNMFTMPSNYNSTFGLNAGSSLSGFDYSGTQSYFTTP